MELKDLYLIIADELMQAGFTKQAGFTDELDQSHWTKSGDELYMIDVDRVYHDNGDGKRDISFKLYAMKSNGNHSWHVETKVKISGTQTEKTIRRKTKDFIEIYSGLQK